MHGASTILRVTLDDTSRKMKYFSPDRWTESWPGGQPLYYKKETYWDFPGGPVAKTMLSMQGAAVPSLVRELLTNTTTKGSDATTKDPQGHNQDLVYIFFFKGNIYYQWSLNHFLRIITRRWHIFPTLNKPYPLLLSFLLPLLSAPSLPLFFPLFCHSHHLFLH